MQSILLAQHCNRLTSRFLRLARSFGELLSNGQTHSSVVTVNGFPFLGLRVAIWSVASVVSNDAVPNAQLQDWCEMRAPALHKQQMFVTTTAVMLRWHYWSCHGCSLAEQGGVPKAASGRQATQPLEDVRQGQTSRC